MTHIGTSLGGLLAAAAAALFLPVTAPAQAQTLLVATGVPKGTYSTLFRDLQNSCGARGGLTLVERASTGASESLDRLMNNEVHIAFVQTDVLYQRAQVDDVARIKALVPLHAEAVHVLVPSAARGLAGMLPSALRPAGASTVGDLAGKRVGAWGGAWITGQQIRLQAQINYELVDVQSPNAGLQALADGRIDALMAVGGAPLDWLKAVDGRLRLLPFGDEAIARLKHVYQPARLHYANLGAAGVATVATTAMLAVRDTRSTQALAPLVALRQCLKQQLETLRETVGNHRAWSQVAPDADPRWPLLGKARTEP